MIGFTWLHSRTQTLTAAAALVIVAIVLAGTGPHLAHLYATSIAGCQANRDCPDARAAFTATDKPLATGLGILLVVAPGLIGLFWGAPLVARELESGTFRLAWTQSVSRTHWLLVKVALLALTGTALAGVLSWLLTWWASPLDRAHANQYASFDQRDIVAIGYTAFAIALGVTAGVVIRRVLPAMATTFVAFVAVRLAVNHWLRPRLLPPAHLTVALDPATTGYGWSGDILFGAGTRSLQPVSPPLPNAWITSTRIVNSAGKPLSSSVLHRDCPDIGGHGSGPTGPAPADVQQRLQACVAKVATTYHQAISYQPANRYWSLQWLELASYLAAALALTGVSIWWLRHRIT